MITPSTNMATELPSSRNGVRGLKFGFTHCGVRHRTLTADDVPCVVHATETVPSLGKCKGRVASPQRRWTNGRLVYKCDKVHQVV